MFLNYDNNDFCWILHSKLKQCFQLCIKCELPPPISISRDCLEVDPVIESTHQLCASISMNFPLCGARLGWGYGPLSECLISCWIIKVE